MLQIADCGRMRRPALLSDLIVISCDAAGPRNENRKGTSAISRSSEFTVYQTVMKESVSNVVNDIVQEQNIDSEENSFKKLLRDRRKYQ